MNKAEALYRKGDTAGALDIMNRPSDQRAVRQPFLLWMMQECSMKEALKLYWEGLRRIDQVRFQTFANTWSEKTVTDDFRVLFPIPQQALDSNPNLTQNAGY